MVFSAEGTFVKMQGDVKSPMGIAIDEDGLILLERGVEIAFLSLIPKDKRFTQWGTSIIPLGLH